MKTAARLLASFVCFFFGWIAVGYLYFTMEGRNRPLDFEAVFVSVVVALMMAVFHLIVLLPVESQWAGMSTRRMAAGSLAAGGGAATLSLGLLFLFRSIGQRDGDLPRLVILVIAAVIATFASLRCCRSSK